MGAMKYPPRPGAKLNFQYTDDGDDDEFDEGKAFAQKRVVVNVGVTIFDY